MIYYLTNELAKSLGRSRKSQANGNAKTLLGEWSCTPFKFDFVDDPKHENCILCVNPKTLYSFIFPLAELKEFENFDQCLTFWLWSSLQKRFEQQNFLRLIAPDLFSTSFLPATNKRLSGIIRGIKGLYNKVLQDEDEGSLTLEELCYEVNIYPNRHLGYRCPLEIILRSGESDYQVQLAH